jgi:hypothetical protein
MFQFSFKMRENIYHLDKSMSFFHICNLAESLHGLNLMIYVIHVVVNLHVVIYSEYSGVVSSLISVNVLVGLLSLSY